MRKTNLLFFCIIFTLYNCTQKNQKATLSAEIENMGNDTIMIAIAPYNEKLSNEFKTIIAKDGEFKLDTLIDKPYYGKIISNKMFKKLSNGEKFLIRSKIIDFFIQPNESVKIKGKLEEYKADYQIDGNILNTQYLKYRNYVSKDFFEFSKLMYLIKNQYAKNTSDSLINILDKKRQKSYRQYLDNSLRFIKENPNYDISAFLLLKEKKEDILSLFPHLNDNVKESIYGELIQKKINVWNHIKIGSKAPDFEYTTLSNKKISLNKYKGKYVVLDFWGSWCGPCMMEMPKLKEFYNQNKDNVEVIGIACRDTKDKWVKSIKKNNLNWTQILNIKGSQDLSKKYGVKGYPTKVIINPNGIIEGVYLGLKDDFFIKMNELLTE